MTAANTTIIHDNSSVANFKTWAQAIGTALTALGWARSSDTGQVNWSTLSAVPSSNYVYEVWKSQDSLSSTLPIYFKIRYGYSTTDVRIAVSWGTATDGAGNLTGQSTTEMVLNGYTTNTSTNTWPFYYAGDTGNFYLLLWASTNTSYQLYNLVCVERSKSAAGADTADYFTVVCTDAGAYRYTGNLQQTVGPSYKGPADNGLLTVSGTSGSGSGYCTGAAQVAAQPVFPSLGSLKNPLKGIMTAYQNDVGQLTTVTVTNMYGAVHTYITYKGTLQSSDYLPFFCAQRASMGSPGSLLIIAE